MVIITLKKKFKAYHANLELFKSKLLTKKAKLWLYNTIIRPIVTYGCETWILKEADIQKLLVFERNLLRIYGPIKERDVVGEFKVIMNYIC